MMLANDHILTTASQWQQQGHGIALAIVVDTWGSSPRQRGALMAIRDDGQIAGSVSGGCVETSVMESGLRLINEGGAERLDFGVADETAWRVGLSCGGRISVWVCSSDAMATHLLEEAGERMASRLPVAMKCDLMAGTMTQAGAGSSLKANTLDEDEGAFLLEVVAKPRVFIIGGVHISQHLAPMAVDAGFDVTVIDPRTTFANAERFPNINLVSDWPQDVLADQSLDNQTALVTLTHDPKIDDAALVATLSHPVFHIACLGSRRTHAARLERLREKGFSEEDLSRIHGPAGLNIGAQTPAEIAVSVLAELIAAWRGVSPEGSGA